MLFQDLKHDFPLIHVSRRLPKRVASSIDVNTIHDVSLSISESEEKRQMRQMKDRDHNSSLPSFEHSFGGHVPVGKDDDVDDDARLPLRSVFPISFDCLDSHVAGPEDDADDEHVGSRSIDELCSDKLRQKRRLPKHKRQQQQRRSALAPNDDDIGNRGIGVQGNGSIQPVGGTGVGVGKCMSMLMSMVLRFVSRTRTTRRR